MSSAASTQLALPPRVAMLLPVILLVHVLEEWFGGFPEWTALVFDNGLEPGRFVLINSIGFLLFSVGTLAAFRDPGLAWLAAALAALVVLNAALHLLLTVALGAYSPGVVTGLLLYLPAGIPVLRWSAAHHSRLKFHAAVVFGVLLHGAATLAAFGG